MRDSIWSKRFPTLLGLIMIVGGIVATSYLNQNGLIFGGKASPSTIPHNVRITNISDTSFTVSYFTDTRVTGSLVYGPDEKLGNLASDIRDTTPQQQGSYATHYILVSNLQPNTKYFFTLSSGGESFNQADTNAPFIVTTGPPLQANAQTATMTGKVILSDGSPAAFALVYVSAPPNQMISALTQSDGSYTVPLSTMRAPDGSNFATLTASTVLHMFVSSESLASQVTLLVNQSNPVPTITLSNSYDFSIQTTPLSSTTPTASSGASFGFPAFTSRENTATKAPAITSPKTNEGLNDAQPVFKGTAPPGQTVSISIHSTEVTATVTADQTGTWSFRPTQPLSPGTHTITMTTKDAFGILKTITQSFTVYAAGSQVSQSATPSATLAITPTSRPTATPTLVPTATPLPTQSISPTGTSISPTQIQPTSTIIPTIAATSAPTQPPVLTPQPTLTPGSHSVVWMGLGAVVVTLLGASIFFATRIPL